MTDKITEGRAKAITDSLEAAGVKPSKCSQEPMCPALHTALHDVSDLATRVNVLAVIVAKQGEEIKKLKGKR